MDNRFIPFLRWTERDREPDTPAISLELRGPGTLWRGSPYLFEVTLRRVDNEDTRPCVFPWSPQIQGFTGWRLMLLRHLPEGFEKIEIKIPPSALYPPSMWVEDAKGLIEHGHDHPTSWIDILPDCYRSFLQPGERYTLLWPGGRHDSWAWGTKKDYLNKYIPIQSTDLVLPGSANAMLSFVVEDGEQPLSAADIWPMELSSRALSRDETAPVFTARIECASTTSSKKWMIEVTMHITYHPGPLRETRPVTFHLRGLRFPDLYQWNGTWQSAPIGGCGYAIFDGPDRQISPGDDEDFATLFPGETWSNPIHYELPENAQVGDLYRFQFDAEGISWWDWGTREDHRSTIVTVPCWIWPKIIDPSDNDGRPVLVVPAPSPVEFRVV